ncbi:hypothetical protein BGZ61DRAFT_457780 [Ilyonectria robusta]|uniref:uncharacterized protein n=1 Tax=Ilyonectria robusta TaxID=1079257 RepID=UPI001E8EDD38|nr:uncharacterized protein BGZ61DRAFT_457780 [Ilyonectria robusta]KAH8677191.1 hypothetical protein BGZ61DRAFT_457780 [Ilyonectria robusta]
MTMQSSSTFSTTPSSLSAHDAEPASHQVFRVESPQNHHKLFIQTSSDIVRSFFAHVIHTADTSQPAMTFVEDVADTADPLAAALNIQHLGSVAPGDFDRLRAACRENPPPEKGPTEEEGEEENLRRSRVWLHELVHVLVSDGILKPPPLHDDSHSHHRPRHHHTHHCIHQRLHCHHPYRRRGRQQLLANSLLNPAATVQER